MFPLVTNSQERNLWTSMDSEFPVDLFLQLSYVIPLEADILKQFGVSLVQRWRSLQASYVYG